ncbi:MAG: hypothetical protein J0M18_11935 [Ignavibacteria bacterium]|nr:hypothetical protein [Ignavibacteria bacterium]
MIFPGKFSLKGDLKINADDFKNCECHYEYNEDRMTLGGYFVIVHNKRDQFFHLIYAVSYSGANFVFKNDTGTQLYGIINNVELLVPFNYTKYKFNFSTTRILSYKIKDQFKSINLMFLFNIPYISFFDKGFSKELERPRHGIFIEEGEKSDYYFKINNIHLWVKQEIEIERDGLIKATLRKKMFLESIMYLENGEKHFETINATERIVEGICYILSFIFSRKIFSNGFNVEGINPDGTDLEVFHRNFKIKKNDFEVALENINAEFKNYFTEEKLTIIIESFVNLETHKKEKVQKFINMFCTCYKLNYFEANFLYMYSLLEGVSKCFWSDEDKSDFALKYSGKYPSNETIIKNALQKTGLEKYFIFFKLSKKKNTRTKWYITDYRNDLMHFNDEIEFDEELFWESMKMMQICRKLIFAIINPEFIEFPFHDSGHNNTQSPKGFDIVHTKKED